MTPAMRDASPTQQLGGEVRSTKAGVMTPAMPPDVDGNREVRLSRSTKAGVMTPAMRASVEPIGMADMDAQRRPG